MDVAKPMLVAAHFYNFVGDAPEMWFKYADRSTYIRRFIYSQDACFVHVTM
jgi:hypothetical protein